MININMDSIKKSSEESWIELFQKLIQKTLELNAQFNIKECKIMILKYDSNDIRIWFYLPNNTFTLYDLYNRYDLNADQQFKLNHCSKVSKDTLIFTPWENAQPEKLLDTLKEQLPVKKRIFGGKQYVSYTIQLF